MPHNFQWGKKMNKKNWGKDSLNRHSKLNRKCQLFPQKSDLSLTPVFFITSLYPHQKLLKDSKPGLCLQEKKRDLNKNKCVIPMEIELHGISFSIVISGTYKFCFLLINSSGVEICMQFTIIPFHKCLNLVVF